MVLQLDYGRLPNGAPMSAPVPDSPKELKYAVQIKKVFIELVASYANLRISEIKVIPLSDSTSYGGAAAPFTPRRVMPTPMFPSSRAFELAAPP